MEVYMHRKGEVACFKTRRSSCDRKLRQLTEGEKGDAEHARQVALIVLRDALRKKDRVLMEEGPHDPMPQDTAESLGPAEGTMMRYAIITPSEVKKLIEKLEKIKFVEDDAEDVRTTFAYVYPEDETFTVYLCPAFWGSPVHLAKNSQPGTLIHEVSHFLGSEDIDYDEKRFKVAMGGNFYQVMGGSQAALEDPERHCQNYGMLKNNANSITFEFEILLRHSQPWSGTSYPCCGETREHSVCEKAVSDEFAFFLGDD